MNETVEALLKKAAETDNACEALQFSQAALNAANAVARDLQSQMGDKPSPS